MWDSGGGGAARPRTTPVPRGRRRGAFVRTTPHPPPSSRRRHQHRPPPPPRTVEGDGVESEGRGSRPSRGRKVTGEGTGWFPRGTSPSSAAFEKCMIFIREGDLRQRGTGRGGTRVGRGWRTTAIGSPPTRRGGVELNVYRYSQGRRRRDVEGVNVRESFALLRRDFEDQLKGGSGRGAE